MFVVVVVVSVNHVCVSVYVCHNYIVHILGRWGRCYGVHVMKLKHSEGWALLGKSDNGSLHNWWGR